MLIKNKYLIFPVNNDSENKRVSFGFEGNELYGLDIRIDEKNPNFFAYVDVSRFIGMNIDITVSPEVDFTVKPADVMDIKDVYKETNRPQVHFTAKNGWLNDPNGLCCLNGVYHMFFQHNPCSSKWGNMHWGHAVSNDLIHWEEKDIALFPDNLGTMFSGSAFIDNNNTLGLNNENSKAMALFYTAAADEKYVQCLAVSVDGGKTFKKYENNPIIDAIVKTNRDPKVVYCEEIGSYLMALYLESGNYALLTSDDLVHWNQLQRSGDFGDRECPDIINFKDADGKSLWVFIGANNNYTVGEMTDKGFKRIQETKRLHYSESNYAAQSFNNVPNDRKIRIAWDIKINLNMDNVGCQMGFPTELELEKIGDEYYLRATPIKEIEQLYKDEKSFENLTVSAENEFKTELSNDPTLISLNLPYAPECKTEIDIFGSKIGYDTDKNELTVDGYCGPLRVSENNIDIKILIDRSSIEVFADEGRICFACQLIRDKEAPMITIKSNKELKDCNVDIHSLNSIWE